MKHSFPLGTTGKIIWMIALAIVLVALFSGIWILLGAAFIMVAGLWMGEGRLAKDGNG
jgi:hypothetical protein